ncbi:MAG: Ig-like domain repeat protein [Armatimonadetes bacterium]|nr:Ig-like domain repeat protein [Armatimonadota bacterium]
MHKALSFRLGSRIMRSLLLSFALLALVWGASTPSLAQIGKPWAWGYNGYGQFGDGTNTTNITPVHSIGVTNVVQVSGGYLHSLFLKSNGTVWGSGYNAYGELGNGTTTAALTPVQATGLTGIVQVSAGFYYSLAVKKDGTVWGWGYNSYGELGDGASSTSLPVQVLGVTNVVQAAAGVYHSLFLKSDGTVWACGYNEVGELGNSTLISSTTPVQVSGLTNVVQVAAGLYHSLAVKADGTVWAWGNNGNGELGDGTFDNKGTPVQVTGLTGAVQVSAGYNYSLALISDGTAWGWGINNAGQLGDGTGVGATTPVQVSGLFGAVQVSGTYYHSLAVKSDGTIWSWGYNGFGALGDGTYTSAYAPVQVTGLNGQTNAATAYSHSVSVQAYVLTTSVSPSGLTQAYGKPITVMATLKNSSLGGIVINRALTFTLDGSVVGVAYTNAAGRASMVVPSPLNYGAGAHTFIAAFAGGSLYKASTGTGTLTITKADSAISVAAVSGAPGNSKYLYASLKRKTDNIVLSGRTLTFKVDGNAIGTAVTDGKGKAALLYKLGETYGIGAHVLTAEYAGDANHNTSTGTGTLTVVQSATKLTISSVSGKVGAMVLMKGKLVRTTDTTLLNAKTIRFEIDGVEVGSAVTASGIAPLSFTIPNTLTVGVHTLKALFDGDVFYSATGSVGATLTVK